MWLLEDGPGDAVTLTLATHQFARSVRLSIRGIDARFSDNYFPGWEKSVRIGVPPGASQRTVRETLSITHLGLLR